MHVRLFKTLISACPRVAHHRNHFAFTGDMSDPTRTLRIMKAIQQEPLPRWGGARKGAGRKRKSPRKNVPHRPRKKFRRGALHVTLRVRREVWNLRTHRCFRALERAFAAGCERFGYRLVEFSVQGNHIHMIVEAPDVVALARAMKGIEVRMARAAEQGDVAARPRLRGSLPRAPAAVSARGVLRDPVRARELGRARSSRRPARAARH